MGSWTVERVILSSLRCILAEPSKYTGADATIAQLKKLMVIAPNQFSQALRGEAEIEATEVKKETPVDTGALRGTVHVEGPKREGRSVKVWIVAGGPAATYAFIVHEDLEAFHKVGNAKYIERPLRESAPYIPARVAARVKLGEGL